MRRPEEDQGQRKEKESIHYFTTDVRETYCGIRWAIIKSNLYNKIFMVC